MSKLLLLASPAYSTPLSALNSAVKMALGDAQAKAMVSVLFCRVLRSCRCFRGYAARLRELVSLGEFPLLHLLTLPKTFFLLTISSLMKILPTAALFFVNATAE